MKNKIFIIILLFSFLTIFLFINPTYIGYTIYQHTQPDIELDLTKTIYSPFEYLDGAIKLKFNGPINADSKIKITINSEETEKSILEILNELYKVPLIQYGTLTIINDEQTKILEYNQPNTKKLATQVTSEVSEFSFDIEGLPLDNSYPKFLTIDILDNDIPDYIYLGEPSTDYKPEIKADSLDTDATKIYHQLDPKYYYCELIKLPYTQHIKINADYSGTGIVSAIILPVTITGSDITAYSSPDICTLSQGSCVIQLQKPTQGHNLICINTSSSNILLSEEDKNLPNSNGYKCEIEYINKYNESICTPLDLPDHPTTRLGDFFITIQVPEYTGELKTSESFTADIDIINNYFATACTPNSLCTIPISISSDSKGKLKISNINIRYGSKIKNFLSDYIKTPDIIYEIDYQNITDLEILIPLSIFNITIPEITDDQEEFTVKVELGTEYDKKTIQVYKIKSADAFSLANELYNKLYSFTDDQKEIISSLGLNIDTLLTQIENYQQEIQSILNSTTLTESEREYKLDSIKQSLENIKQTLPSSIKITKKILNIPTQPSTKISDIYLLEEQRNYVSKQKILNLQSQINIKTDLTVFQITTNDITQEKTLVKKTITGNLEDFYLIEEIPKTIASSINEIRFNTDNYEIIQEDPIVRWSISSLPATITYIVPNDISNQSKELRTIAIPKSISYEPAEPYKRVVCGDGICTIPLEDKITCPEDCMKKINWWFVIFLIAILVGGIYYLNFYKGKLSFQKLTKQTKKPSLFKTKADEINLRNYIKKSLAHKIPKSRIKNILLAKGWSEEQIEYIFKTL